MFKSVQNQSGFGSVVLLLMIFVLTVAIGYSVSQVNRPSFKQSYAADDTAPGIDTINLDGLIQAGIEGIQNVINSQVSDANQVLSNPNSTQAQKDAAQAVKTQRESDQAKLDTTFGKVTYDDKGKPDYTERNKMITWQWDGAAIKNVVSPRNGFEVDVQNHPPINDNSSHPGTRGVAGAAAAAAVGKK